MSSPTPLPAVIRRCALAAYLLSFALPVFDNYRPAYHHMSVGPRGLVFGLGAFLCALLLLPALYPAWLANPAFWLAFVLHNKGKGRAATAVATVGLLLGATALFLLSDESNVRRWWCYPGYYVWMASLALLAAPIREAPSPGPDSSSFH